MELAPVALLEQAVLDEEVFPLLIPTAASSTKGYNRSPGPTKITACKSPLALVMRRNESENDKEVFC